MSKAEKLALEYCKGSSFEDACMEKPAYIAGYTQAEKDTTDVFIEKTEKFMNTVNEYLYHCVSEECDYVDTDKFIYDFKNFIKGE